jgi:hypothetical protein
MSKGDPMAIFTIRRVAAAALVSTITLGGLALLPAIGPLGSQIAGAQATTTLTVSATPNPAGLGANVTITADLEGGLTPSGDISWLLGTGPGCTGTVDSGDVYPTDNGVITLETTSTLAAGDYYVDAFFTSSDTNLNLDSGTGCPSSPTFTVLSVATTTLTLSVVPSTITYGDSVTYETMLSGGGTSPMEPVGSISAVGYRVNNCSSQTPAIDVGTNVDGNGAYDMGPLVPPAAGRYWGEAYFADTDGFNSSASSGSCDLLFTVKRAHLVITAPTVTTPFGTPPNLTPTPGDYSGFVNGDTSANLTTQPSCTTTATSTSPPGHYPVTCSGASDPNYIITYQPGVLTIVKASTSFTISDFLTHHGKDTTAVLGESGIPGNARGTVLFETGTGVACVIQLTGRPGEATTCFADFGSNVPFKITGIFFDEDGNYQSSDSTNTLMPHSF